MQALKVALDARLEEGIVGGLEQFVTGLAMGFSEIDHGEDEYYFLTYKGADEWLRPHLQGGCRAIPTTRHDSRALRIGKRIAGTNRLLSGAPAPVRWTHPVPTSDGTIEQLGVDVMHFTTQLGFVTRVPTVYQPWDLQHVHLPELFTKRTRALRELHYATLCRAATSIVVASEHTREDIARHFKLSASRILVLPPPAPVPAYGPLDRAALDATRTRLSLPASFAYYPAQTWRNKNHARLLEALAILRDRLNTRVPLICTGHLNDYYPELEAQLRRLRLDESVRFLGFLPRVDVQHLYKLCRLVVFPSLFEGWGLPLAEAMQAGAPIACSRISALTAQANGAAVFFDPRDADEIAQAIFDIWTSSSLRVELAAAGQTRAPKGSWSDTARTLRAEYRRIAGRPLDEVDRALLQAAIATKSPEVEVSDLERPR